MVAFNKAEALESVLAVASKLNRKFEASDVTPLLQTLAVKYADAYEGDFEFMVQMRGSLIKWGNLTTGQAKGVLNCMAAEARKLAKSAEQPTQIVQGVELKAQRPGTYTLILDEETGERITLRLTNMKDEQLQKYNKKAGTQVIEYMNGPDNESSYRGYGFVTGRKVGVWKKFRTAVEQGVTGAQELLDRLEIASQLLMDANEATLHNAGYAWALVSGKCYRCGHKLTVPASICAGLGPVCNGKEE
jgi:hypothetical protein